jgi:electron transfer flavoprotein alpha subunit
LPRPRNSLLTLEHKVDAVVLGSSSLAQEIAAYDLEKVISAENDQLAEYHSRCLRAALEQVIRSASPQFVIMSHTYLARDFRAEGCGSVWQRFDWRLYSHER